MKITRHDPEGLPEGGLEAPPGGLRGVWRAWNRFWFRPADPLPLGVIRVFTGIVILYLHLIYSLDLQSLVSRDGWSNLRDDGPMHYLRYEVEFKDVSGNWADYEGAKYAQGQAFWSVYFHITDPGWIVFTHCAFLLVMFLFTIGFATRLTAVLTWVGVLSYIHRLPVFLYGLDSIMNVLVLYLMVGPSGAAFSVDRLLQKWWAKKHGQPVPPVRASASANFALRLMQIQMCIIYIASGLSKLQGEAWWTGTALWGTLANYSFSPMNIPLYVDFLKFLSENRFLCELIMIGGSYFTLMLEISFIFLIWSPRWRWLMICFSVMLHTGIGIVMGLTTFSLLMMCLVLSFVPASTHHAFVEVLVRKTMTLRELFRGKPPAAPAPQQPMMAAGA
jgi:hypothetical protein